MLRVALAVIFSFLTFASGGLTVAQENPGGESPAKWLGQFAKMPSLTIGSFFKDKYLLSTGSVAHEHSVIQTDLTLTYDNGVYLNVWHSAGTNSGLNTGFDAEID